jgi:hypothetical protein
MIRLVDNLMYQVKNSGKNNALFSRYEAPAASSPGGPAQ